MVRSPEMAIALFAAVLSAAAVAAPAEGRPADVAIQVRILGDKLAAGYTSAPGQGRYLRWAVTKFQELGAEPQRQQLGTVVASELENALLHDHSFVMTERLHLAAAMKELSLNEATGVDDKAGEKMAKLAGVDALVIGSVSQLGDSYRVTARVLAVNEGRVSASGEVNIDARGLIALSSDAVVLRSRSGAVFRSVILPGWGQFYNRQQAKGIIVMTAIAGLGAGALTAQLLGLKSLSDYDAPDPRSGVCAGASDVPTCVQGFRTTAEGRFALRNYLLIGLGAAWGLNVLDAYLSGYDGGGSGGDAPIARVPPLPGE